jgi:hypothetical protein
MGENKNLFTEAKEPVTKALLCRNTKLIRFRNSHPCHRCDISFINLDDLSSPLLLPCQSSGIKFELPRVLQHNRSTIISSSQRVIAIKHHGVS